MNLSNFCYSSYFDPGIQLLCSVYYLIEQFQSIKLIHSSSKTNKTSQVWRECVLLSAIHKQCLLYGSFEVLNVLSVSQSMSV